jgi:hypothetical protein
MMLMQQLGQDLALGCVATDLLDPQRLQLIQLLSNGLGGNDLLELGRQAHPVWAMSAAGRQLDQTALLQFQQQTASRHILEQPGSIAPLPLQGQLPRQTPSAPVPMLLNEQPDFV